MLFRSPARRCAPAEAPDVARPGPRRPLGREAPPRRQRRAAVEPRGKRCSQDSLRSLSTTGCKLDKIDQPYSDCNFVCCGLVTVLSEIGLLAAATSSCHQKSYVALIERPRCFPAPLILLYQRLQGKGTLFFAIVPDLCYIFVSLLLNLISTTEQLGFEEGLQAKQ